MYIMEMLLQRVEEAVTVGFARFIQSIATEDANKDFAEHFAHCHTHGVTLKNSVGWVISGWVYKRTMTVQSGEFVNIGPQITKEVVHCKLIIRELDHPSCLQRTRTVGLTLIIIQRSLKENNLGRAESM